MLKLKMNPGKFKCTLFLLILQVFFAYPDRYCKYHYHHDKKRNCVLCDKCPSGEILTKHCGYDDAGNKISPPCIKCDVGTYSQIDKFRDGRAVSCELCLDCNSKGREIRKTCTVSSNAICGRCLPGFSENSGKCVEKLRSSSTTRKITTTQLQTTAKKITTKSPTTTSMITPVTATDVTTTTSNTAVTKSRVFATINPGRASKTTRYRNATARKLKKTASDLFPMPTSESKQQRIAHYSMPNSEAVLFSNGALTMKRRLLKPTAKTTAPYLTKSDNLIRKSNIREHLSMAGLIGVAAMVFFIAFATVYVITKQALRKNRKNTLRSIEEAEGSDTFQGKPQSELLNKAVPMTEGETKNETEYSSKATLERATENHWHTSNLNCMPPSSTSCENVTKVTIKRPPKAKTKEAIIQEMSRQRCITCRQCSYELVSTTSDFRCEKKIEELGECQRKLVREKLDMESTGIKNWKEVAQYFNVPQNTIQDWKTKIKAGESPTESLIVYLITLSKTVSELLLSFWTIERKDVHQALTMHLKKRCCLCRREKETNI